MIWRDRIAILLALLILLTLTVGSYWLAKRTQLGSNDSKRVVRHEPDYFVEDFTLLRMKNTGYIGYTMHAPKLAHYPDDDSSVVQQPILTSHANPHTPIQATAQQATIYQGGATVLMEKNVRIDRAPTDQEPALTIRTERLTINPDEDIAYTGHPVTVIQGVSTLTGIGMHLDNAARKIEIKRDVKAVWSAPK